MKTDDCRAWIGVASNIEHESAISAALANLNIEFGELQQSPIYRSPCVRGGKFVYWNLAVGFATRLDANSLRLRLKSIEALIGRERGAAANGRVKIDLDLLVHGDWHAIALSACADLDAAHVFVPLADLLPNWRAPGTLETLAERARQCRAELTALQRLGELQLQPARCAHESTI